MLKTDATKQVTFLKRVMFLHQLASKRGGKSASVRLSADEWVTECDRMCLLCHVWVEMASLTGDDGFRVFDGDELRTLNDRIMEGCPCHIKYAPAISCS